MNETKERIIAIATRLFTEMSYRAISFDHIAKEANVSKVTMYKYFESKDRLIEAVLRQRIADVDQSLTAAIHGKNPGMDQVREIFNWYERWFSEPDFQGCPILGALWEFKKEPDIARLVAQQQDNLFERIHDTLTNVAPPSMINHLSRQFICVINGAIIRAQAGRKGVAAEEAWECARQLIEYAVIGRSISI